MKLNINWMTERTAKTVRAIAIILTALTLSVGLGMSSQAYSEEAKTGQFPPQRGSFTVEIAEDFATFIPGPPFDNEGVPQRGSYFITEGNIYPEGTFQGDGASFDPNAGGAIGKWFCRGTHLVSGLEFPNVRFAVDTAQAYLFPDDSQMLVTDGLEGGFGHVVQRVISGGTGKFRKVVGVQKQELIGFNLSGGVNLRVTFKLDRIR